MKSASEITEEWIYNCIDVKKLKNALAVLSSDPSKKSLKRIAEERLSLLEKGPTSSQKAEAEATRKKGNDCVTNKDYPGALAYYTESIKKDPTEASGFSNRSLMHYKSGNYKRALDDANRAILVNKEYLRGYQRRAEALLALGEYQKAYGTLKAILKKDPANKSVFINSSNISIGY